MKPLFPSLHPGTVPGPGELLAQLLDALPVEAMVSTERHQAGQAALARPAMTVMGHGAKRVAIVLDTSASMKATDVSSSRFVQAQRQALGLLGQLGEGAEVMVIEAGVQPRVVEPFTRKHEDVSSAIRSLQAKDLPNKLGEAIREAMDGGSPMSAPIARKVVQSFHAPAARGEDFPELSQREHEVLNGLAEGLGYKQIADQLDVSIHTVRNYIRRIYEKLHVRSRTEAVAKFLRH